MPGIAHYRTIGTVVAQENERWSIEDDDGRLVYVPIASYPQLADLRVGDRVEIAPIGPEGPVLRPYSWAIVRKLETPSP